MPLEKPKRTDIPEASASMPADIDPFRKASIHAGAFARPQFGKIGEKYRGVKTLGTGAFGTVLSIEDRQGNQRFACKCLSKSHLDKKEMATLEQEIHLLRSCDHPNIMKFYAYFEDNKQLFLVCELCEGGELFDYITDASYYADKSRQDRETSAAQIMTQVLSGVAYLHAMDIVHRDLKPENVLLKHKGDLTTLKIIDFGLGARYHGEKMNEQVGTPYYIAPEVLEKNYGPKCDVWSLGVILYVLIAGQAPFWGPDDKTILRRVRERKYTMSGDVWKRASPEVKDLIQRMLTYPASKRLSAQEALQHPWFKVAREKAAFPKYDEPSESLETIMTRLRKFRGHQKLAHAARLFISYNANKDAEIERLTRIFEEMDKDGNRVLDRSEISGAYMALEKMQGRDPSELKQDVMTAEIDELFKRIDVNGDGFVEISEWLAVVLDDEYLFSKERLRSAFDAFDADGNGTISVDEILQVIKVTGDERQAVIEMIRKFDANADGEIDFDEFSSMMEKITLQSSNLEDMEFPLPLAD